MKKQKRKTRTETPALFAERRSDGDLTMRALSLRAATLDEEARTVDTVVATETPASVFDWATGRMVDEVLLVRGASMPAQVVMLDSHQRWSNEDVIGSVRNLRVEGDTIVGTAHFADGDARAESAWNKVRQGHITDFSAGYRVEEFETVKPNTTEVVQGRSFTAGQRALRVTTKWSLREASLVPIGADAAAKIRSESERRSEKEFPAMKETQLDIEEAARADNKPQPPQPKAEPPVDQDAIRADAVRAERERVAAVRALAPDTVPADVVQRAIDEGMDEAKAGKLFLETIRNARPAPAGHVELGRDNNEDLARAISDGVCLRIGAKPEDPKHAAEARKYAGIGLRDAARLCIESAGERAPHSVDEFFKRAISTTAFANLLSNTAHKSLHKGYGEAGSTFLRWAGVRDVTDFKQYTDIKLGNFGRMTEVGDGGELQHKTLDDSKELFQASTYGALFALTRKTFINDDLNALTRIPMELGRSAARSMDDTAYDLLVSQSGLGPTMQEDSEKLFSASHSQSNYSSTTATDGMTDAGMTMAKKLLRQIKYQNQHLNLVPRFVLVPPEQADAAERLIQSRTVLLQNTNSSTREILGDTNIHQGLAEIIVEPRLSAATDGDTAWYLLADPSQAETLVAVFLNGQRTPVLERHDPQNVLGMGWRIYYDFGVAAIDWRGAVKSKGD